MGELWSEDIGLSIIQFLPDGALAPETWAGGKVVNSMVDIGYITPHLNQVHYITPKQCVYSFPYNRW